MNTKKVSKKNVPMPKLTLKLITWPLTKFVNGEKIPIVDEEGQQRLGKRFEVNLPLLGETHSFGVITKVEEEMSLLYDFFGILGKDEMPVELVMDSFINKDNGEVVEIYNVLAKFSDIHSLVLKPHDSDKNMWKMGIREVLEGYDGGKAVSDYRIRRKAEKEAWLAKKFGKKPA